MSEAEITKTGSASHAPKEVMNFAEKIGKAQGCRVVLARENSGFHLYMPCPDCLLTHGRRELADPKYSINISKYLALGDKYAALKDPGHVFDVKTHEISNRVRRERNEKSSICMRSRQSKFPHRYSVRDLLQMSTITERHPDIRTQCEVAGKVGSAEREEHWEVDPVSGVKCPPPPGQVVPIYELGDAHPARMYLEQRGYDLKKLWHQFRCSYCVEEYPEGTNGIYYRKMPGFWKDTPRNRIIFYSMVDGAPMTWQARYPEVVLESGGAYYKYMLHPYPTLCEPAFSGWSHTHTRANAATAWIPVSPFNELDSNGTLKFQPSKYRTAKYSSRQMMGWDAALERANKDPEMLKWCVLCEGPLDAARVGPGGIALIGSSISADNAALVARNFHFVFTAFDTDMAGKAATEKVGKMLMGSKRDSVIQRVIPLPITGGKDLGDMTQEAFDQMFLQHLKTAKRGL